MQHCCFKDYEPAYALHIAQNFDVRVTVTRGTVTNCRDIAKSCDYSSRLVLTGGAVNVRILLLRTLYTTP